MISVNSFYTEFFEKSLGLFGGFYHNTAVTHLFHIFLFLVSSLVLQLNGFYPRKFLDNNLGSFFYLIYTKLVYNNNFVLDKRKEQYTNIEYPLIILFVVIGGSLLITSSDLISIFLSIELQSYGLYILCAVYKNSERSTSGALTYFLLGGLSSCFILLSFSLLYSNSGNTSFDGLYVINYVSNLKSDAQNLYKYIYLYDSYYINFSLVILSIGLLFKIGAAPFHFWSPDVYDGIPTVVTTFVAVFAKISIFILLLELVHYTSNSFISQEHAVEKQNFLIENTNFSWTFTLLISSFMSLMVGAILGLTQFRIKRLYAYSTISHIGFILLALTINTIESVQSFIFYLMQYSLSNLNAFILLIYIGYSLYFYVEKYQVDTYAIQLEKNKQKILEEKSWRRKSASQYENLVEVDHELGVLNTNEFVEKNISYTKKLNWNDVPYTTREVNNKELLYLTQDNVYSIHSKQNIEEKLLLSSTFSDKNNSPIQLIKQLKGYFFINPLLAISFSLTIFSFVGIPPLIGFFAKQMVLSSAIYNGYVFMALIAILTSVISAYYYLALVKQIFFHETNYTINPFYKIISLKAQTVYKSVFLLGSKNKSSEERYYLFENVYLTSSLSVTISVLTLIILIFILIPQEWLNLANILALILFNS